MLSGPDESIHEGTKHNIPIELSKNEQESRQIRSHGSGVHASISANGPFEINDLDAVESLLYGGFTESSAFLSSWKVSQWKLKIFVSSGFSDSLEEKKVIISDVGRKLRSISLRSGIDLYFIDCRQDVVTENSDIFDHSIWTENYQQLMDCARQSRGIFYLSLFGSKYGRCLPPEFVDRASFEHRVSLLNPQARDCVLLHYVLDSNFLNPKYVLKRNERVYASDIEWNSQTVPLLCKSLENLKLFSYQPNSIDSSHNDFVMCAERESFNGSRSRTVSHEFDSLQNSNSDDNTEATDALIANRSYLEWEAKAALTCDANLSRCVWFQRIFTEGNDSSTCVGVLGLHLYVDVPDETPNSEESSAYKTNIWKLKRSNLIAWMQSRFSVSSLSASTSFVLNKSFESASHDAASTKFSPGVPNQDIGTVSTVTLAHTVLFSPMKSAVTPTANNLSTTASIASSNVLQQFVSLHDCINHSANNPRWQQYLQSYRDNVNQKLLLELQDVVLRKRSWDCHADGLNLPGSFMTDMLFHSQLAAKYSESYIGNENFISSVVQLLYDSDSWQTGSSVFLSNTPSSARPSMTKTLPEGINLLHQVTRDHNACDDAQDDGQALPAQQVTVPLTAISSASRTPQQKRASGNGSLKTPESSTRARPTSDHGATSSLPLPSAQGQQQHPPQQGVYLCITGPKGSGKSATMAKLAEIMFEMESSRGKRQKYSLGPRKAAASPNKPAVSIFESKELELVHNASAIRPILVRFCGLSSMCNTMLGLLTSVNMHIVASLKLDEYETELAALRQTSYLFAAVDLFQRLVRRFPVIIFIVGLNRLQNCVDDSYFFNSLKVHKNTRILVSFISGDRWDSHGSGNGNDKTSQHLLSFFGKELRVRIISVPLLNARDCLNLVEEQLSSKGRTLTSQQYSQILSDVETHIASVKHKFSLLSIRVGSHIITPLQSMLLVKLAQRLHSFDTVANPFVSSLYMNDLLQQYFFSLEIKYGMYFVRKALEYITVMQESGGVTDVELCDLLSLDDIAVANVQSRWGLTFSHATESPSNDVGPDGHVPMFVWTSLKLALDDLIIEMDNGKLIWRHSAVAEYAKQLAGEDKKELRATHATIGAYFTNKTAKYSHISGKVDPGAVHSQRSDLHSQPLLYSCHPTVWHSVARWSNELDASKRNHFMSINLSRLMSYHHLLAAGRYIDAVNEFCNLRTICAYLLSGLSLHPLLTLLGRCLQYFHNQVEQSLQQSIPQNMQAKNIANSIKLERLDEYICWLQSCWRDMLECPQSQICVSILSCQSSTGYLRQDISALLLNTVQLFAHKDPLNLSPTKQSSPNRSGSRIREALLSQTESSIDTTKVLFSRQLSDPNDYCRASKADDELSDDCQTWTRLPLSMWDSECWYRPRSFGHRISAEPMISAITGHSARVTTLALSQSGDYLYSTSFDTIIIKWDTHTLSELRRYIGHTREVTSICLLKTADEANSDEDHFLTSSVDATILLWYTNSSAPLRIILAFNAKPIRSIAVNTRDNPAYLSVVLNADKTVRIWAVGSLLSELLGGQHNSDTTTSSKSVDSQLQNLSLNSNSADFVLAAHSEPVVCACFAEKVVFASLTGQTSRNPSTKASIVRVFCTGSMDCSIRVWNFALSGPPVPSFLLKSHKGPVVALDYCSNTEQLFSASDDGTAKIWCPFSGSLLTTLVGHTKQILSLSVISTLSVGSLLMTGSMDGTVRVWNCRTGAEVDCINTSRFGCHFTAALLPAKCGHKVYCGHDGKDMRVWKYSCKQVSLAQCGAGENDWIGHSSKVSLICSTGGSTDNTLSTLVSFSNDGILRIWSHDGIDDMSLKHTISAPAGFVSDICILPASNNSSQGSTVLQVTESLEVRQWDLSTGSSIITTVPIASENTILRDSIACHAIRISSDGSLVACAYCDEVSLKGEGASGMQTMITIWETQSRLLICKFKVVAAPAHHADAATPVDLSSHVSGVYPEVACSSRTKDDVPLLHQFSISTSSSSSAVISNDMRFSPNNEMIIIGANHDVHAYSIKEKINVTIPQLLCLQGHQAVITAIACSTYAPGRSCSIQSKDNIVVLEAHGAVCTEYVASGDANGVIRIWELKTGNKICICKGHTADINALYFDSLGLHRLVSASADKSLIVWDALTGLSISRIVGHLSSVSCALFTADGYHIISAGEDKLVLVWEGVK